MTETAKPPLKVGDKLWCVNSLRTGRRTGGGFEVEVTKIGRKWATIGAGYNEQRIDLKTWRIDGGNYASPGRCYASQDDYRAAIFRIVAWDKLQSHMRNLYCAPEGVDLAWIEAAAEKLGVPK